LAGEALYPADVSAWLDAGLGQPTFVNMYGITETTVHSTYHEVGRADLAHPKTSRIGRPLPGWGTVVVDSFGRPCPDGVPGELLVSGDGVARGYLGRPDLTGERFCWVWPGRGEAQPVRLAEPVAGGDGPTRAYRSGDSVSRVSGQLVYHGRIDDQVQLRGFRIELGDVVAGLEATGLARAAVARVVAVEGKEPFLAAWVVPTDVGTSASDVRRQATRTLPAPLVPSRVVFVDHIPTTPNGKPDLAALTLPPAQTLEEPEGMAAEIAAVWEQVIGAGPVGVQDRFMEVGGTSMHVMEVHDVVSHRFDIGWLTAADLFAHPAPEDLADHIRSRREADERVGSSKAVKSVDEHKEEHIESRRAD
jgi:hypothetical protein